MVNPDPGRGQFSSLQIGLHEVLNHGRDAAMVTLVDRPPVSPATIQILRDAFEAADQKSGRWCLSFPASTGIPTWWAVK